jgi:hypothetical protein
MQSIRKYIFVANCSKLLSKQSTEVKNMRKSDRVDTQKLYWESIGAIALGRSFGLKEGDSIRFSDDLTHGRATEVVGQVQKVLGQLNTRDDAQLIAARAIVNAMDCMQDHYINKELHNYGLNDRANQAGHSHEVAPLPLAGWNNAYRHLQALQPTLQKLGIEADLMDIVHEYDSRTIELLKTCDINNPEAQYCGLQEYLLSENVACCNIGSSKSNNQFVNEILMQDLLTRGFGSDLGVEQQLKDLGIDVDGRNYDHTIDHDIQEEQDVQLIPGNR